MTANGAAKVQQSRSGAAARPKRKKKPEPRSIGLIDLMRRVLLLRNGAVTATAAVTRRELGMRPRRVREANRARQARRAARVLTMARRPEAYRV